MLILWTFKSGLAWRVNFKANSALKLLHLSSVYVIDTFLSVDVYGQ